MSETIDVFLSHHSQDKPAVEALARKLSEQGLSVWLDKWNLIPGKPWQETIEQALQTCQACAIFLGPKGRGPWQHEEMRMAIDRRVTHQDVRIIPVLLPGSERPERSELPAFLTRTTWVEFQRSVEDEKEAFHRLVCGIKGVEPGPPEHIHLTEGECPYRGLQAFEPEHADFFFGREALVEWILDDLKPKQQRAASRFVAIVGASGSGKSSLARAGLISALKDGALEGSATWPILITKPGSQPLDNLAADLDAYEVLRKGIRSPRQFVEEARAWDRELHLSIRKALAQSGQPRRSVILIDQFEELFTLCDDEEARLGYIANVLHAAKVLEGSTIIILTMRADFYGKCANYPELADLVSHRQMLVGPMSGEELRRAIERPAQMVGCEVEPGLIELLVLACAKQTGALPLLQDLLATMWSTGEGNRRLTITQYNQLGGLHAALDRRAEAFYERLDEQHQELCRFIFKRLTQPGQGTEDTKRRMASEALAPGHIDPTLVESFITDLANERLVSTDYTPSKQRLVEVAHEALIRGWDRLRFWIDEDREALVIQNRLIEDVCEWQHHGRDDSYLYGGLRLARAEQWLKEHPGEVSKEEAAFIEQSQARESQRFRITEEDMALTRTRVEEMARSFPTHFRLFQTLGENIDRSFSKLRVGNSVEAAEDLIDTNWALEWINKNEHRLEELELWRRRCAWLAHTNLNVRLLAIQEADAAWQVRFGKRSSAGADALEKIIAALTQLHQQVEWTPAEELAEYFERLGLSSISKLNYEVAILAERPQQLTFNLIPAGRFLMGSSENEEGRNPDEHQHPVVISRPFYLGSCPVTQGQYATLMGGNPSHLEDERIPVTQASWKDARRFCEMLSKQFKRHVRLPTEAEWEFACRAGTSTRYHSGDTQEDLERVAWFGGEVRGPAHAVGEKDPNGFGLVDMHGNVLEWCEDWYDEAYYQESPRYDPRGPDKRSTHVLRGGSWSSQARDCRAACRGGSSQSLEGVGGFRVVVDLV